MTEAESVSQLENMVSRSALINEPINVVLDPQPSTSGQHEISPIDIQPILEHTKTTSKRGRKTTSAPLITVPLQN